MSGLPRSARVAVSSVLTVTIVLIVALLRSGSTEPVENVARTPAELHRAAADGLVARAPDRDEPAVTKVQRVQTEPDRVHSKPRVPTTQAERLSFVYGCLEPRRQSLATTLSQRHQFVLDKLTPEERGAVDASSDALVWAAARGYVEIDLVTNDIVKDYLLAGSDVPLRPSAKSLANGLIAWQAPRDGVWGPKGARVEIRFDLDADGHPSLAAARARCASAMADLKTALSAKQKKESR